ncbi:MAG: leucine-rich repeat domain-containing protein [Mycoplasmoidaceae bacterium]|nr:leucine-rich repeat domain-containing protein [Mycoplasmoidaceae bacterium]
MPANIKSVTNNAFYNGSGSIIPSFIENLTFAKGSNCSTIGNNAFNGALNLTSINLPSRLTTINQQAFMNCRSLNYIG